MKGKKSSNSGLCIFFSLVIIYALAIIISQKKQIEKLENANPYSGYIFATIQVHNEETGKYDTYQGTLDFDCGLHGEWLYEINGLEAVMNGARKIGSVEPDNKQNGESKNEK